MVESVRNLHPVLFIGVMWVVQTLAQVCPYSDPGGNITNISSNSLPPGLTHIWLYDVPLTNISDDGFDASAATLETVSIHGAELTSLPTALKKLTTLTYLSIVDTIVEDWDPATLKQIAGTLECLELNNVGLSSWPSWISDFRLLHTIDLSYNSLKSIPDDAFSSIKDSLASLVLVRTGLTQVPHALSILLSLETLSLGLNNLTNVSEIEKITRFPFAQKLSTLYLEEVGLTTTANFSNLTSLWSLGLPDNRIADVPAGSLPASLRSLDLTGNSLSSVPLDVASMSQLSDLNLFYNLITGIEPNSFPSSLTTVKLSSNNITIITNSTFRNLNLLSALYVDDNPISTISPSAFSDLLSLHDLYLTNSHLTEIPVAFAQMSPRTYIFLTTTQLLSCPCPPPQELLQWFASLTYNFLPSVICSNGQLIQSYLRGQCGQLKATP